MKHSLFDFLRSSLIPELRADVTASTACHIHLILIMISAIWAFPNQFAIFLYNLNFTGISAYLTEITLGIQLCIHDVIINVLHYGKYCIQVLLHIRYFHITDGSTRRQFLELSLKF